MTNITLTSLEYEEICDSISTIPEEYELDAQSEDRKLDSFEEDVCEAIREIQKHKAKDGIVVINGLQQINYLKYMMLLVAGPVKYLEK